MKDYEDILPESSTQLVSLNTRIPRNVSKLIDECMGILQLASKYHKVTKQEAILIILENGIHTIREEFASMDSVISEVAVSTPEIEEIEEIKSEDIASKQRETIAQQAYDMKAYAEFSNKSSYTPRKYHTKSENSEIATKLQTKLGLR